MQMLTIVVRFTEGVFEVKRRRTFAFRAQRGRKERRRQHEESVKVCETTKFSAQPEEPLAFVQSSRGKPAPLCVVYVQRRTFGHSRSRL
jgi:hypothetical protein